MLAYVAPTLAACSRVVLQMRSRRARSRKTQTSAHASAAAVKVKPSAAPYMAMLRTHRPGAQPPPGE